MLTGNLLAIGIGGIITVAWSLVRPANFDWDITRAINAKPETLVCEGSATPTETPAVESEKKLHKTPQQEKSNPMPVAEEQPTAMSEDYVSLQRAFRFASWSAIALTIVLIIVSPLAYE
jgi:hypothetical protein